MYSRIKALPLLLLALLFLSAFYGCPGSKPTITIQAIDCPTDQITIDDKSTVRSASGDQWVLNAKVIVKCNGEVYKDAEIIVSFWWPNGTTKLKTNEKGEATYTKRGHGSLPYGEKFKVTIKGSDGEKEKEFELKRNN
jgi:hypothetical protein